MTKLLSTLLESVQHAGADRRKELAKMVDPKLTYEFADGTTKPIRELILSDSTTSTTLIQSEVYNTVLEGSMPVVGMRNALDVINVKSNSLRVNYGTTGVYAPEVDEGSEIPIYINTYTPVTFTIRKYGYRPVITKELVNDGLFDVIAEEIKYAGRACENKLNQLSLSNILEGSGNETDRSGSNLGVKAIAAAIGVNKNAGFTPTDVIMHPEAEAIVLQDYIPTGAYYQVGNPATTGVIPAPILGLRATTCGVTDTSSTYVWDYDSDGDMGMLILDRSRAGKIAMRQDISVEQYADPIRDLVGLSTTIRFDCQSCVSTATTRVEY